MIFFSLKWSHFDLFWTIFFIRSTVNLEWFSGETVLEMLAWHCSTLREDINAITIMNNHLSWLEPSPQIPAPVFFKTKTPWAQCPGGTHKKWSNDSPPHLNCASSETMKKLSEKVGRIPWIGNKSHVRLFALWQDKKGFIYGTLMCSLPFSPGERDTTTLWMAIAFSLGQGPDKKS